MSQPFKTDSLRPSSLPSATLGRRRPLLPISALTADQDGNTLTPEERARRVLQKEHEKWNERIDRDVKGCVDGLKELVQLADIDAQKSTSLTSSTLPLHLPVRTNSLIGSAINLRDIAHELKLLLLLSDEVKAVQSRDREKDLVMKEIEELRKSAVQSASKDPGESSVEETLGEKEKAGQDQEIGEQIEEDSTEHKAPAWHPSPLTSPAEPLAQPSPERPEVDETAMRMDENEDDDEDFDMVDVDQPSLPSAAAAAHAPLTEKSEDSDDDFEEVS